MNFRTNIWNAVNRFEDTPKEWSMIQLKRVYEKPSRKDGVRILVDRLWPRGLTKERAAVNLWLKDVAPSPALRKWFADGWVQAIDAPGAPAAP